MTHREQAIDFVNRFSTFQDAEEAATQLMNQYDVSRKDYVANEVYRFGLREYWAITIEEIQKIKQLLERSLIEYGLDDPATREAMGLD
jgi:hypothetical protein